MNTVHHSAGYLFELLTHPQAFAIKAEKMIPVEVLNRVPILVATGVSGILGAGALASRLNLPVGVVRKDNDKTHSMYRVELPAVAVNSPWIFVDDLVDTGQTKTRVRKAISSIEGYRGEFLGTYLYESNVWQYQK